MNAEQIRRESRALIAKQTYAIAQLKELLNEGILRDEIMESIKTAQYILQGAVLEFQNAEILAEK